eukprot:Clim_evm145s157 gene=Clim_evmTU145s157
MEGGVSPPTLSPALKAPAWRRNHRTGGSAVVDGQRFDLLLLEAGDTYLFDRSVLYNPPGDFDKIHAAHTKAPKHGLNWLRGRLFVCTYALYFEPRDLTLPIVKIAYEDTKDISSLQLSEQDVAMDSDPLSKDQDNYTAIQLKSTQWAEMRQGNQIGPHIRHEYKDPRTHKFLPRLHGIDDLQHTMGVCLEASRSKAHQRAAALQPLIDDLGERNKFDYRWMFDSVAEETLMNIPCRRITPMVSLPGRVVLSNRGVYYQSYAKIGTNPVYRQRLSDLKLFLRRRVFYELRGVELIFAGKEEGGDKVLFLAFDNVQATNVFLEQLAKGSSTALHDLASMGPHFTWSWLFGEITTFDYLMFLNHSAGRSFNDLSQYPVFPWIIQSYEGKDLVLTDEGTFRDLSKPIGALEPGRLEIFRERYDEMPEPKFMYGSHYSTPGYVLHYLVREVPQYLLCLQNGRFDHADRTFTKIGEAWQGVLTSRTDLKELIPEFFMPPGDFLINLQGLRLGTRQAGGIVDDVILPPWANGSAKEFTEMQCKALNEAPYVNNNIQHWIDLIFGYKQQGGDAVKANNVFHPMTYEEQVDWTSVSEQDAEGLKLQIQEFGQTPMQLFHRPHPPRIGSGGTGNTDHIWKECIDLWCEFSRKVQGRSPLAYSPQLAAATLTSTSGPGLSPSRQKQAATLIQPLGVRELILDIVLEVNLHSSPVTGIKVLDDLRMAIAFDDGTVIVYDGEEEKVLRQTKLLDMPILDVVDFDGGRAILSAKDSNLHFFMASSGMEACAWTVQDALISGARFDRVSKAVYTSGTDGRVAVHRVPDGIPNGNTPRALEVIEGLDRPVTQILGLGCSVHVDKDVALLFSSAGHIHVWHTRYDDVTQTLHIGDYVRGWTDSAQVLSVEALFLECQGLVTHANRHECIHIIMVCATTFIAVFDVGLLADQNGGLVCAISPRTAKGEQIIFKPPQDQYSLAAVLSASEHELQGTEYVVIAAALGNGDVLLYDAGDPSLTLAHISVAANMFPQCIGTNGNVAAMGFADGSIKMLTVSREDDEDEHG